MYKTKLELINLSLFGYGFVITFFKWNYNPLTGDGSVKKYSVDITNNKYINPSINFTINYNYDFNFKLKINRD